MKHVLLGFVLICVTTAAHAGDNHRGSYEHYRSLNSHQHHRHAYHPKAHSVRHYRRSEHLEHIVGGVILGAVLYELIKPPVYETQTLLVEPRPVERTQEYVLDLEGRCYSVTHWAERRVLTEVLPGYCRIP